MTETCPACRGTGTVSDDVEQAVRALESIDWDDVEDVSPLTAAVFSRQLREEMEVDR